MADCRYGFETKLRDVTYADAVQMVTQELKKEGFGVLTEIDVRQTLKKKLDVDFRPYLILGACNPPLAKQALESEPQIGLLLPCNVVARSSPVIFSSHWAPGGIGQARQYRKSNLIAFRSCGSLPGELPNE